jgi:hypothetical protein
MLFDVKYIGVRSEHFNRHMTFAVNQLNEFLMREGWPRFSHHLVKEVIHFDTKQNFDHDLLQGAGLTEIPKTFVALGEKSVLKIVSFEAYKEVFPLQDIYDYQKILIHELAHIFHANLVGDEHMGPIWFFEGFAIIAANQYENSPQLNSKQKQNIITESVRGSYADYGALLRLLLDKYNIKELVERVARNDLGFMDRILEDQ